MAAILPRPVTTTAVSPAPDVTVSNRFERTILSATAISITPAEDDSRPFPCPTIVPKPQHFFGPRAPSGPITVVRHLIVRDHAYESGCQEIIDRLRAEGIVGPIHALYCVFERDGHAFDKQACQHLVCDAFHYRHISAESFLHVAAPGEGGRHSRISLYRDEMQDSIRHTFLIPPPAVDASNAPTFNPYEFYDHDDVVDPNARLLDMWQTIIDLSRVHSVTIVCLADPTNAGRSAMFDNPIIEAIAYYALFGSETVTLVGFERCDKHDEVFLDKVGMFQDAHRLVHGTDGPTLDDALERIRRVPFAVWKDTVAARLALQAGPENLA